MSVLPIAMQSCEHVLEIPLNDGSGRVMCVGVPVQWWSGLDDDGKRVVIEKFRASFLEQGASDVVRIGLCDCYTTMPRPRARRRTTSLRPRARRRMTSPRPGAIRRTTDLPGSELDTMD